MKPTQMDNTIDVLGVKIRATNLPLACKTVGDWIISKKKTYVCIAPVSTVIDSQTNQEYKNIVNNAGMATPDGMPLVWLGKLSGNRVIQRTYGPDLMLELCAYGQDRGFKHYFYGASDGTNSILLKKLQERFPQISVVGKFAPPMRDIHEQESDGMLAQINQANPDILWVGLGSPKQDYWMHQHRSKLDVPVMIGVGAAFDFIAGTKAQAPRWMQRAGLEWLFRLCCEPKRLWKRYLIGNTKFVVLIVQDFIMKRFKKRAS